MTKLYDEIKNLNKEITKMTANEISFARMGGRSKYEELTKKVKALEDAYIAELKRLEIEFEL
jgi:hypothetical protein